MVPDFTSTLSIFGVPGSTGRLLVGALAASPSSERSRLVAGFRAQAKERLFLAVVNQAISDVLENGKEAKEAERWLLNDDFGALDRVSACGCAPGTETNNILQCVIWWFFSSIYLLPRVRLLGLAASVPYSHSRFSSNTSS